MKSYLLKDILRDAVELARETGIWQLLTLPEKEMLVSYFLLNYSEIMTEAESIESTPSSRRDLRIA